MTCSDTSYKFESSQNNSDSSVVNLVSTDDEVYSITSEEEEFTTHDPAQNQLYFQQNQQVGTNKILIDHILGPPCGCRRKCRDLLNKNQEIAIFANFWNLPTREHQNYYLYSCIQVGKKKTKRESRRTVTAYYTVDNGGVDINVCKTEFMSLHGLQNSKAKIDSIIKKKKKRLSYPC